MRALGARFPHQRRHQRAQEKRNKSGREAVLACGMEFDVRGGGGASRTRARVGHRRPWSYDNGSSQGGAALEVRDDVPVARSPSSSHCSSSSYCVPLFPVQIDLGPGHVANWRVPMETWVCPSSRHVPIEFVSFLDSLSLRSPWFPTSTYCFGTCPRGILKGARETLGGPREYTNGHKLLLGHTEPVHY
jgi:hypothetical protein